MLPICRNTFNEVFGPTRNPWNLQLTPGGSTGGGACLTWLIAAALFRYSSLAALIAFLAAPIYAFVLSDIEFDGLFLSDPQRTEFAAGLFLLILLRHAGNIRRLIHGDEPRIGGRGEPAAAETPDTTVVVL